MEFISYSCLSCIPVLMFMFVFIIDLLLYLVQSDLADIQTRTRQLDGAMRCIDQCCRKVVLNFHAAYIAPFAGCYLGPDNTYRARIAPVNHNATNDFAVIAEITLNYSRV